MPLLLQTEHLGVVVVVVVVVVVTPNSYLERSLFESWHTTDKLPCVLASTHFI